MELDFKDPKVKQVQEVYQSLWAINKTTAKFTKRNAESFGLLLFKIYVWAIMEVYFYYVPGWM